MSERTAQATTDEDRAQAAALLYRQRRDRVAHPAGSFDSAGRWYPTAEEDCGVTTSRRSPSRAYPYSYMTACRTADHVAKLCGVAPLALKRAAREQDAAQGQERGRA